MVIESKLPGPNYERRYSNLCPLVCLRVTETTVDSGGVVIVGTAQCPRGCKRLFFPIELVVNREDVKSGRRFVTQGLEDQIRGNCSMQDLFHTPGSQH